MNWTASQREAIGWVESDICVDASAGSGKTSVLIERLIHLFTHAQCDFHEIVAITFTEAAATEMRKRLRTVCYAREQDATPEERDKWHRLGRQISSARISTIHGFCAGLLRTHAVAFGLDPDFVIMAEPECVLLRRKVVDALIQDALNQGDEQALYAAEQMGIEQLKQNLLYLLSQRGTMASIDPDTMHSPETLIEHWRKQTESGYAMILECMRNDPLVADFRDSLKSFEGLCTKDTDAREKARREMLVALTDLGTANTVEDLDSVISILKTRMTGTRKENWPDTQTFDEIKRLQGTVKKWAEEYEISTSCTPDEQLIAAQLGLAVYHLYRCFVREYDALKDRHGALDFDDLILRLTDLFENNTDVCREVASHIRFLMVDEFQDTDSDQYRLVQVLEKANPELSVFIVGDAKQSIYGFRGAEVDVFQVAHEDKHVIRLDHNFRTTPALTGFINDFFASSGILSAIEPQYNPMVAARTDGQQDCIDVLIPDLGDEKKSVEERFLCEARLVAARLVELCHPDSGIRYGDVAILFRESTHIAQYIRALREWGIPFEVVSGRGFYRLQEVTDIQNLLQVVVDPWDEIALLGFLRGPIAGLRDDALVRLCRDTSIAKAFHSDEIPDGFPQTDRLLHARRLIADLCDHREMPLPDFMRYVLQETGYTAIVLSQHHGTQRALNVRKLAALADDFSSTRLPRLADFVQYIQELNSSDLKEGEASACGERANAVQLMTIHASKGLEFSVVVLPGLATGKGSGKRYAVSVDRNLGIAVSFSTDVQDNTKHRVPPFFDWYRKYCELSEESRILYVAMTRARDRLLLAGSPKDTSERTWFGEIMRFVMERRVDMVPLVQGDTWQLHIRNVEPPDSPAVHHTKRTVKGVEAETSLLSIEDLLARCEPVPVQGKLRQVSVTDLAYAMAGLQVMRNEPYVVLPKQTGHADPMLRGTLLHAVLQSWDVTVAPEPLVDRILRERSLPLLNLQDLKEDIIQMCITFRDAVPGCMLREHPDAIREQPFVLRMDDVLVPGSIDVVFPHGAILDYKTGQYRSEKTAVYEWQIRLYALAVQRLIAVSPPAAYIYFVEHDKMVEVDVTEISLHETYTLACTTLKDMSLDQVFETDM